MLHSMSSILSIIGFEPRIFAARNNLSANRAIGPSLNVQSSHCRSNSATAKPRPIRLWNMSQPWQLCHCSDNNATAVPTSNRLRNVSQPCQQCHCSTNIESYLKCVIALPTVPLLYQHRIVVEMPLPMSSFFSVKDIASLLNDSIRRRCDRATVCTRERLACE